jgi:hypothetical protein
MSHQRNYNYVDEKTIVEKKESTNSGRRIKLDED